MRRVSLGTLGWLLYTVCMLPNLLGETGSDDRIRWAVRDTYVYQNCLKGERIEVESVEGVVQLTGEMGCALLKTLAEATASRIPGVQRVENRIRVHGSAERLADDRVSTQLKSLLKLFEHQFGADVDVEVSGRIVTLRGVVPSTEKAQRIGKFVMGLEGVSGLQNHLKVDPALRIVAVPVDDASVEAQSWTVLQQYRFMRSLPVTLDSKAGVVFLTGSVSSPATKDLVSFHLQYINGVVGITNRLSLAPSRATPNIQAPAPPQNVRIIAQ